MQGGVFVLGDGVAALSAAIGLARAGCDVSVQPTPPTQTWMFPETLASAGIVDLARLGIAGNVLDDTFSKVKTRFSRWGTQELRLEHLHLSVVAQYILGKAALIVLLKYEADKRGVRMLPPAKLVGAVEKHNGIQLILERGNTSTALHCAFAIDASGRACTLARKLGVSRVTIDDLVSFWIECDPASGFAHSVATASVEDGWIFYAAPSASHAALAFFTAGRKMTSKPSARDVFARLPTDLMHLVRARDLPVAMPAIPFNASTSALRQSGGRFWLACGDALQTVDPLSSSGVATALQQAASATQAILAAFGGDRGPLARYRNDVQMNFTQYVRTRNIIYGGTAPKASVPDTFFQ